MGNQEQRMNTREIAEALGADVSIPAQEALGVSFDAITPLGFLALADAFNARQTHLRQQDVLGESER